VTPSPSHLRGILTMTGAVGVLSLNDVAMKLAMGSMAPGQSILLRGALAIAILMVVVGVMRQVADLPRAWSRPVFLRTCAETMGLVTWILALPHIALSTGVALYMTTPLFMLVAVAILDGVKLSPSRIAGVGVGFLGALMVVQPKADASVIPSLLVIGSAIFTVIRDRLSSRVPEGTPVAGVVLVTLVLPALAGLLLWPFETWTMPQPNEIAMMAGAAVCLMIGLGGIYLAFRMAPPAIVSPYFFTQVVWALIGGVAVFGERPNALALAGMVLVVGAGLMLSRPEGKRG
jgi:drug/metabolite transporter (DMT)-like permease